MKHHYGYINKKCRPKRNVVHLGIAHDKRITLKGKRNPTIGRAMRALLIYKHPCVGHGPTYVGRAVRAFLIYKHPHAGHGPTYG